MKTKSLRTFAEEHGVTIRDVQRHVKKHEKELEGHIKRYGAPKGTYIDSYAEEFISELMIDKPIAVLDPTLSNENDRLKTELEAANKKIIALMEAQNALVERAMKAEAAQAMLEAAKEEQDKRAAEMESSLKQLEEAFTAEKERADAAEETTKKLKGRNLWQRLTRWGE